MNDFKCYLEIILEIFSDINIVYDDGGRVDILTQKYMQNGAEIKPKLIIRQQRENARRRNVSHFHQQMFRLNYIQISFPLFIIWRGCDDYWRWVAVEFLKYLF